MCRIPCLDLTKDILFQHGNYFTLYNVVRRFRNLKLNLKLDVSYCMLSQLVGTSLFNPGLFHFLWGLGWKKKWDSLWKLAGQQRKGILPGISSFIFVWIQVLSVQVHLNPLVAIWEGRRKNVVVNVLVNSLNLIFELEKSADFFISAFQSLLEP